MKDLAPRLVSGLIFGFLVIGAILLNQFTCIGLLIIIGVLGILEFQRLAASKCDFNRTDSFVNIFIVSAILIVTFISAYSGKHRFLAVIPGLLFLPLIFQLFSKGSQPITRTGIHIFGLLYVAIPLATANYIVFTKNHEYIGGNLLALLLLTWTLDVFAYGIGSTFGKRPLFKRISPKKSVEGLIGGSIFCIGSSYLYSRMIPSSLELTDWIALSIIVVIFGTLGDLIESMFKRDAQIKDSGAILPGHGGILDRFDALFFILPFAAIYILIFANY